MSAIKFSYFYERALARKGSEAALRERLPKPASREQLLQLDDRQVLAEMTRCIFRAGFAWRVIENKWPGFDAAFAGFFPPYWQQVPPERLDELARDERIVRNPQKIATVPVNARMIVEVAEQHGSFGAFLADWPADDQAGLQVYLKKYGSRLGGTAAQHVLRRLGWDGYIYTPDTLTALRNHKLLDASEFSKRGMQQIQTAFNEWQTEAGLPYCQLSRILSMTLDAR